MSKRVANTRDHTARKGRVRHSWRRIASQSILEKKNEKNRLASITKLKPKMTTWQKIKNYIRRRCGKQ